MHNTIDIFDFEYEEEILFTMGTLALLNVFTLPIGIGVWGEVSALWGPIIVFALPVIILVIFLGWLTHISGSMSGTVNSAWVYYKSLPRKVRKQLGLNPDIFLSLSDVDAAELKSKMIRFYEVWEEKEQIRKASEVGATHILENIDGKIKDLEIANETQKEYA